MKRYLGLAMLVLAFVTGIYSLRQFHFEAAYNKYIAEEKTIPFAFPDAFPAKSEFALAYLNEIKGNLDEAADSYFRAFSASEETDAYAMFNLGNVVIARAFKKMDVTMVAAAIEYYKESLRLKPDFMEAKYNLEEAMRFLENIRRQGMQGSGAGNDRQNGGASHQPFKAEDI